MCQRNSRWSPESGGGCGMPEWERIGLLLVIRTQVCVPNDLVQMLGTHAGFVDNSMVQLRLSSL